MAEPLSKRSLWMMLGALMLAELAGTYETAMVYAALPTLFKVFDDVVGVTWLITIYMLVGAVFAVISSRLGDIFGRAQMLMIVLGLILVGSIISSLFESLPWLIAGRALQGSAAAILPLCYGIARERIPAERMPWAIGLLTGAASVGAGLGLIIGAMLIDNFPWRSIFIFSAFFAAISIAVIWRWVPRFPMRLGSIRGLDIWGGALFAPALLGLLLVLTNGSKWGWSSPVTLALGVGSVLLMAIWARHELRHPNPLIDVRLLARPQILVTNLIMATAAIGAYQVTQVVSILLQQPRWTLVGLGVSATVVGLIKLPANLSGLFGSLASGSIAQRRGGKPAAIMGSLILAAGWGYLTINHDSVLDVLIALLLTGFGLQMLYAAMSNLVIAAAPADRTSEATGLTTVIRAGSSAVGSQLIALTLASSVVIGGPDGVTSLPSEQAFMRVFIWITLACLACALLAMMLPGKRRPADVAAASPQASNAN